MNATAESIVDADTQQFLTFKLAGEEYGVGILSVQEIRGWSAVTAIPHSPNWLLGVINLRGVVVPIIDLRIKFNFAKAEYNEFTVVIILNVGARVVGIVVDGAGIGSCMTANKVPGVRAALCYDLSTAANAREHNHANVLTLGAGMIGEALAKQIVDRFLDTPFGGDRHARRVAKIGEIEGSYLRDPTTEPVPR